MEEEEEEEEEEEDCLEQQSHPLSLITFLIMYSVTILCTVTVHITVT